HTIDPCYGQPGRKQTADPACDQLIARLNVRSGCEVAHFHLAIRTTAKRDQSQTIAQYLYGNGKLVIINERSFRRKGRNAHDLPDHATFVDDRHARLYSA